MNKEKLKALIRENYSQIAKNNNNNSCCEVTNCCNENEKPEKQSSLLMGKKLDYDEKELNSEISDAYQGLGCGNPNAIADLKEGETVLDLGCGAGFDVFIASEKVGSKGKVIGVDMTPEMIDKARNIAKKRSIDNVDFRLGEIENLPVADKSVDVIISNCVINLSVDKKRVYQEIYRVLKSKGRIAISDVLKKNKFPEKLKNSLKNYSNCIEGAITKKELKNILEENNFKEININIKENSDEIIENWSDEHKLSNYIFSAYITATKV